MNYKVIFLLFFGISTSIFCQRTLPNPIILVHGWTGSNTTWTEFTNYLEGNAGLTIERNYLKYQLNCDNSLYSSYLISDVCDSNSGSIGNKDVYVIDFNQGFLSNQSAVVKQGYALRFAINKVLRATGADKVILLGHSMGGLAIREYLQNSSNWQPDGQHHVAKLVTIGTPHRGSNTSGGILTNAFSSKDENSESVRDLRESYIYSNCTRNGVPIQCPGVYLWGGQEKSSWMVTDIFGLSGYYNFDVNCNGRIGDSVLGLNQKSIIQNVDYACVIGGPTFSDGIVSIESQNLNTIYPNIADVFYWDCVKANGLICHTREPKQAFEEMLQAIDEPKKNITDIEFGKAYSGFFTRQSFGSNIDTDEYYLSVPQRGVISFTAKSLAQANATVSILDPLGKAIFIESIGATLSKKIQVDAPGGYRISIQGNSLGTWSTFGFSFGFCPLPPPPTITNNSDITFCDGQSVELSATTGYETYSWHKDGVPVFSNVSRINANTSGTYTLNVAKCGLNFNATNNVIVNTKPLPIKPAIIKEEQPTQFLLKTSSTDSRQWQINGLDILGATEQTYIPQDLGTYSIKAVKDGCFQISDPVIIKVDKPSLTYTGTNPFCDGDSLQIIAPSGFGGYIFSDGIKEYSGSSPTMIVRKSGKYSVVTQRGKFSSPPSDSINITNIPKPLKPTIQLEGFGLKSSSSSNNQWYLDGNILKDSTGQYLNKIGSGTYRVRVTESGCFSESDVFLITASEPQQQDIIFNAFPNPTSGTLWFLAPSSNKFDVFIFDGLGRLIKHQKFTNVSNQYVNLDLNQSYGEFLIVLQEGSKTFSTKVFIK